MSIEVLSFLIASASAFFTFMVYREYSKVLDALIEVDKVNKYLESCILDVRDICNKIVPDDSDSIPESSQVICECGNLINPKNS